MIGFSSQGGFDDRKVAIEVTGFCHQELKRRGTFTLMIPYSRLNQTMKWIDRLGGRIAGIRMSSSPLMGKK
jgi:phycocyanin-associated rod protein